MKKAVLYTFIFCLFGIQALQAMHTSPRDSSIHSDEEMASKSDSSDQRQVGANAGVVKKMMRACTSRLNSISAHISPDLRRCILGASYVTLVACLIGQYFELRDRAQDLRRVDEAAAFIRSYSTALCSDLVLDDPGLILRLLKMFFTNDAQ